MNHIDALCSPPTSTPRRQTVPRDRISYSAPPPFFRLTPSVVARLSAPVSPRRMRMLMIPENAGRANNDDEEGSKRREAAVATMMVVRGKREVLVAPPSRCLAYYRPVSSAPCQPPPPSRAVRLPNTVHAADCWCCSLPKRLAFTTTRRVLSIIDGSYRRTTERTDGLPMRHGASERASKPHYTRLPSRPSQAVDTPCRAVPTWLVGTSRVDTVCHGMQWTTHELVTIATSKISRR